MVEQVQGGNWFVRRGDTVRGPFTPELIQRQVQLGCIGVQDELSEDQRTWLSLRELRHLVPDVMFVDDGHHTAREPMNATRIV